MEIKQIRMGIVELVHGDAHMRQYMQNIFLQIR